MTLKDKTLRKDAYVLVYQDEEGNPQYKFPQKDDDPLKVRLHTRACYLFDYKEVEAYVKRNMGHVQGNILICKVVDLVEVRVKSVDDVIHDTP